MKKFYIFLSCVVVLIVIPIIPLIVSKYCQSNDDFLSGPLRIIVHPKEGLRPPTNNGYFFNQFILVGKGTKVVDSIVIRTPEGILMEYKVASVFPLEKKSKNSYLNVLIGSNPDFSRESPVLLADIKCQPMNKEGFFFISVKARVNGAWMDKTISHEW